MEKIKIHNGLFAYRATAGETHLLGGRGICDECNQFANQGYLVPVLNHYQCPKCFQNFKKYSINYPEDRAIEQRSMEYYEHMIPIGEVAT